MKNKKNLAGKVRVILLISGLALIGLAGVSHSLEKTLYLEELKEPRLYLHFFNLEGVQAMYLQLPDAGEVLIIGGDKDISDGLREYIEKQFALQKGRIVSGLRKFLGWKHRLDVVLNTSLSPASIENILSLYREMDLTLLVSCLSRNVPQDLRAFPQEIKTLGYIITNYPGYLETKKGSFIPLPAQQRARVNLEVLSPQEVISYKDYQENFASPSWQEDNSLVLKLSFNEVSFLLPSFIGPGVQRKLVEVSGERLASTVLVMPQDFIPSFLEKVNAEIFIFSGPKVDIEDLILVQGKTSYFTSQERGVFLVTDGQKIYVRGTEKIRLTKEKKAGSAEVRKVPEEGALELESKAREAGKEQQERIQQQLRKLEEQRKAEEERRAEQRRLEEHRRIEEEKRKEEEQRKLEYERTLP